jgi:tetratricopeptide (TPR) repeat protein
MWVSGERGLSAFYADLLSSLFNVVFNAGTAKPSSDLDPQPRLDQATIITATAEQSADLLARLSPLLAPLAIEQFAAQVDQLAVEYMASPPAVMAAEARKLRDHLLLALTQTRRPSQISDLYVLAGRTSGILAYAALDHGNARAAMINARTSLAYADLAGHTGLSVWVRGTQSLIARFAGHHRKAEEYVLAGMELDARGIGHARLAAGHAQCRAHLGDVKGVREALQNAANLHAAAEAASDEIGLFGFARSKVHYYGASALVSLPDGAGAEASINEALIAIELFRSGPAEDRFHTDEILAHIHGGNALIQQGQLDTAADLLDTVLRTPEDQRVSWHRQRLAILVDMLRTPRFRGSQLATGLLLQLDAFNHPEGQRP